MFLRSFPPFRYSEGRGGGASLEKERKGDKRRKLDDLFFPCFLAFKFLVFLKTKQ